MTRQRAAWIAAAALALTAVLAALWGFQQRDQASRAANQLEAGYQRAFFALVEHVENLETLLAKALASGSPMHQAVILTRVQTEAQAAQEALAALPVGLELQRSHQFLAQAGDYAYVLAEGLAAGQAPGDEAWTTLAELKSQAAGLMEDLARIRRRALEDGFRWTEAAAGDGTASAQTASSVPGSLQELDRELQEVPALIYDGPFSEQNLRPQPRSDLGPPVDADEAARRAAGVLSGPGGGRWRATVENDLVPGPVPAYAVTLEPQDDGPAPTAGLRRVLAYVSRAGGRVLWFLAETGQEGPGEPAGTGGAGDQGRPGAPGEAAGADPGRLRDRAADFLSQRGFDGFVETGWVWESGRVTFSLVPERGGIRFYPELVKVTLDGEGRVLGYDASAYWLNRDPGRRLPEPALSGDDARGLAGPLLQVQGVRRAVIPLPSGRHVLAWEVLGTLGEDRFLLYYNAVTGREEMILRLVETDRARITF